MLPFLTHTTKLDNPHRHINAEVFQVTNLIHGSLSLHRLRHQQRAEQHIHALKRLQRHKRNKQTNTNWNKHMKLSKSINNKKTRTNTISQYNVNTNYEHNAKNKKLRNITIRIPGADLVRQAGFATPISSSRYSHPIPSTEINPRNGKTATYTVTQHM